MSYYIISFDPGPMEQFQKRFSFLEDAIWIEDQENLTQLLNPPGVESFYIVHLTNKRDQTDDLVLTIREKEISAKIIYIVEEGKALDLKSHQMTPVGGDAYVSLHVERDEFESILQGLKPVALNPWGNRLEIGAEEVSSQSRLEDLRNNPKNIALEKIFAEVFDTKKNKPTWQSAASLSVDEGLKELELPEIPEIPEIPEDLVLGDDMSDKDQELSLDDLDDLGDIELGNDLEVESENLEEEGLDLDLGEEIGLDLSTSSEVPDTEIEDSGMDLDLDESLSLDDSIEESDDTDDLELSEADNSDLDFSLDDIKQEVAEELAEEEFTDLGEELSLSEDDAMNLDFNGEDDLSLSGDLTLDDSDDHELSGDIDLSDDAREKLKEIDAIMDHDSSQVGISVGFTADENELNEDDIGLSLAGDEDELNEDDIGLSLYGEDPSELTEIEADSDLEQSLVSDDLDLESLNFTNEEPEEVAVVAAPSAKKTKSPKESYDGSIGKDLKEISGAYSGEMDRVQATISNLRSDREELLTKIQKFEEDKILQNRQMLTMRAELDEKKIELSIVRKKLNEEISELKDRQKVFEEKKLILEERNRILNQELDKTSQKNKIDVRKVQMRERELEQKLELLKADSETQIRHRDLKILELKRKLDAMEFDVESISVQEQRSVESRFELEDKLDKAIKTLRNAITVLEDENDKGGALDALKKNIDM